MMTTDEFVLFAPNRMSAGEVVVNAQKHPKLYSYLADYFYSFYRGVQNFRPFAYANELFNDMADMDFDPALLTNVEGTPFYETVQDYISDVMANFGSDTIIICSDA